MSQAMLQVSKMGKLSSAERFQTIQIVVQSETFYEGNAPWIGQRVTGWLLKVEWSGDCQCNLSWAERRKQSMKNWVLAFPANRVVTVKARK